MDNKFKNKLFEEVKKRGLLSEQEETEKKIRKSNRNVINTTSFKKSNSCISLTN